MVTIPLKNSAEKLSMWKKSTVMNTLADSKVESQATNISIDPSTAIEINADIAYSIGKAAAGQQLLVKINTTNMLKLTAITSFSAATTFQTFVFMLNEQNEINQIVQSVDYFGSFDVVSFLPKGGYYYVLIYITAGGGDMQFQLAKSDTCSAAEPNDTPSTLAAKVNGFDLTDMFDNINDLDAVHLSVTKPNDAATTPDTMCMSFIFKDINAKGNVNLYIYNVNQGAWGVATVLATPFINVRWAPPIFGDYYVYVQPTSANLVNKEYTFSAGQLSAINVPIRINVGTVTGSPDCGKYGGDFWVNGGSCVIPGWAEGVKNGTNGYPLPNIPLAVRIIGKDKGDEKWAYAVTDQKGDFKMIVSLPYSYGKDGAFSGYKYIHHYDRQRVIFYCLNGKDIYSNVDVILNVVD